MKNKKWLQVLTQRSVIVGLVLASLIAGYVNCSPNRLEMPTTADFSSNTNTLNCNPQDLACLSLPKCKASFSSTYIVPDGNVTLRVQFSKGKNNLKNDATYVCNYDSGNSDQFINTSNLTQEINLNGKFKTVGQGNCQVTVYDTAGEKSVCNAQVTVSLSANQLGPNVVISNSLNGPSTSSFKLGETVYSKVIGAGKTAKNCLENNTNSGSCDSLSNFFAPSTAEWTYTEASDTWSSAFKLTDSSMVSKTFKGVWYNETTKKMSVPVTFSVTSATTQTIAITLSKTLNGPAASSFAFGETIYGKVTGIGASAKACVETQDNVGNCNDLTKYSDMPNADWKYDEATKVWRCAFLLDNPNLVGKTITSYWYDTVTKVKSSPIITTVSASPLKLIYSATLDGPEASEFTAGQPIFGKVIGSSGQAMGCSADIANTTQCSDLNTFTAMPNNDWKYTDSDGLWRSRIVIESLNADLTAKSFWYDSKVKLKSTQKTIKIKANPLLTFSLSDGGPVAISFAVGQKVYGKVTGIGPNAKSCVDIVGNPENCNDPAKRTRMPNSDWTYMGNNIWKGSFTVIQDFAGHQYKGYWYDDNGTQTPAGLFSVP